MKTDNATARLWDLERRENGDIWITTETRKVVATVDCHGIHRDGLGEANARLILQAVNNFDDMLEALRQVTQQYNFDELGPGCKLLVNQAIDNAEKDT